MTTPLMMFHVSVNTLAQDNAPTADAMKEILVIALGRAKRSLDSSKTVGLDWIGDFPRITRRVSESHLTGGTTTAVWPLGYTTANPPPIALDPRGWSSIVVGMQETVRALLTGDEPGFLVRALGTEDIVHSSVAEYNATINGPVTFWSGGQAAITRTRTRFPDVNALGQISSDQNINPVGPDSNDLNITPAPSILPNPDDWKTLLMWAGIIVAAGAAVYLVGPLIHAGATKGASYLNERKQKKERFARAARFPSGYKLRRPRRPGDPR